MAKQAASDTLKLGLVQMSMGSDPAANVEKAAKKVREAAKKGAAVICLPELYRSVYFPQTEDADNFQLAETIPGPTSKAFGPLANELGVVIIAPIFEKRAQGVYHNSLLIFDADGKVVHHYRKMHIPDDPEFYEKFYFAPGDKGFNAVTTKHGRLGTLICWDQWFPEGARLTALRGAQILFYPTAIGTHDGVDAKMRARQHDAWETVQRGHAIANGVFVVAVNRTGKEGKLNFWGQSFVAGPFGEKLAVASDTKEETLIVPIDLSEIERVRHGWPFLRDRRIDAYDQIQARYIDETLTH